MLITADTAQMICFMAKGVPGLLRVISLQLTLNPIGIVSLT